MTDPQSRDMRRHAAEEFLKSYQKQLFDSFQEDRESPEDPEPPPEPEVEAIPDDRPISLSELEAAISDIDQFLESQHQESSESDDLE